MKTAKFPFDYIGETKFGKFYRPLALISIFSEKHKVWFPVRAVIDTGADYTSFPASLANVLGIDLQKDCEKDEMFGIGGVEMIYQYKNLKVKFGSIEMKIPVGFLGNGEVPALLGRLGCLEIMKLVFEKHTSYLSRVESFLDLKGSIKTRLKFDDRKADALILKNVKKYYGRKIKEVKISSS